MMNIAYSILALVVSGFAFELYAIIRAPQGYQDEHGFHMGGEAGQHAENLTLKKLV